MGAFSRVAVGSQTFTVPSSVQRVWVSAIGGGGGSYGYGGGGGGWANAAVNISSTTISCTVGGGGNGTFQFGPAASPGGSSSCLGVVGGGGGQAYQDSRGNQFGGIGGSVTPSGASGLTAPDIAGGSAGSAPYVPIFYFDEQRDSTGTTSEFTSAGNGGYGAALTGGTGSAGGAGQASFNSGTFGGNGGAYGGGGGSPGGDGASGAVYVSWVDVTAPKTTLRSNEPITVSWSSPWSSGSQTVSYSNTGTTNITQTFTATDSRGAQSTITFTILPAIRITSFTANPNPQTSGFDGVPNYDTQLSWTAIGATSASITSVGSVTGSGATTVTNLPQSTAGVTSPATITYTLTATDGFTTATSSVTVSVYNDNTPNNFSIPNQANLDPNTSYTVNIGSITGIDMVTNVIGGPGVTVSKNNLQNYVSSINIVNGDSVQLRFFSDAFNQDPSGLPTVPKTLSVTIGTVTRTFTAFTRAPDVNETFNLPDEIGRVPFPDIDTISELSTQYITSDTLSIDDIELQAPSGVEIKTSNANTQVRINGGPWQDVRSI